MERHNSNLISQGSASSLSLITSLATGNGEVTLNGNSKFQQFAVGRRNQAPMSTTVSYIQPQFNYQQPRHVWTTNPNPSTRNVTVKEGSGTRRRLLKELLLVGIGIIICAIPLAVISTLYAELSDLKVKSSTNNTSTSSTATTPVTTLPIPGQCTSYIVNNDSTRNIASGTGALCDNTLARGWYRFMGGAGTSLATTYVSRDTCSTYYGGSYNGTLPSTVGATTYGTLCVNNNGYLCYAAWSGSLIGVTNCSGYYVYYLTPLTNCNSRYCTTA